MSSDAFSQVLEKLSEWSETDVETNIDDILPTLLSSLSSDNVGQKFQAVQVLLQTCLPCIPVTHVEEQLFQHVIPASKQLFLEAIDCIQVDLEETHQSQAEDLCERIGHFIEVCVAILHCAASVLGYISVQGYVGVSSIYSVPENIAMIVYEAYKHYKESTSMYGRQRASVSELLTSLLKESQQVQVQFFNVLLENVHFNCFVEEELQLLIKVLDIVSNGGEILFSLDLKSMAEHWKGYTRLTQKYMSSVGPHLNLQKPLAVLVLEVERLIGEIIKAPDANAKMTSKCVKVAHFLIRVILKLVEQFKGGHLRESMPCLLTLVVTLYRESVFKRMLALSLCRLNVFGLSLSTVLHRNGNLNAAIVDEIKTYMLVSADPLLTFLFTEPEFRQDFFRLVAKEEDPSSENSGDQRMPLALLIALMKLVLHSSRSDRCMWTDKNSTLNIFSALFSTIKFGHEDLLDNRGVELIVEKGLNPRQTDIYSALVAYGGALIMSAPAMEIATIENILLDNILQPNPWPALLAADLWVILARSASSKMCFDQIVFLSNNLQIMIDSKIDCPERKHLCSLLRRLVPLLSSQDTGMFAEKYPPKSRWELWWEIGLGNVQEKDRTSVVHDLSASVEESCVGFKGSGEVSNMINVLRIASTVLEVSSQSVSPSCIASVWSVIPCDEATIRPWLSTSECRNSVSCWLEDFLCNLCEVTSYIAMRMNNSQVLLVLQRLRVVVSWSSSVVKLSLVKVLQSLAVKGFDVDCDQTKVCSEISALFSELLQDKNPMVSYITLEVFSEFARLTKHQNIFTDTIGGNENLRKLVTNYFQKSLPQESITNEFTTFVHQCAIKEAPLVTVCPPCKKFKPDNDIDHSLDVNDFLESNVFFEEELNIAVEKLTLSCAHIFNYAARNSVPENVKVKLKAVVSHLQDVIGNK